MHYAVEGDCVPDAEHVYGYGVFPSFYNAVRSRCPLLYFAVPVVFQSLLEESLSYCIRRFIDKVIAANLERWCFGALCGCRQICIVLCSSARAYQL